MLLRAGQTLWLSVRLCQALWCCYMLWHTVELCTELSSWPMFCWCLHMLNADLEWKNHHLITEIEALGQVNKYSLIKCRQLEEMLKLNHLNLKLRCGEIDLWQSQCKQIARYCTKLEHQMDTSSMQHDHRISNKWDIQSLIAQLSALPLKDGDINMHSKISSKNAITSGISTTDSIGLAPTSVKLDQTTPDNRIIDLCCWGSSWLMLKKFRYSFK